MSPSIEQIYMKAPGKPAEKPLKAMVGRTLTFHSGIEVLVVHVDPDKGTHQIIEYQNGSTPQVKIGKPLKGAVDWLNSANLYKASADSQDKQE